MLQFKSSVSTLFLPLVTLFYFFVFLKNAYKVNGVSNHLQHLGIQGLVPGGVHCDIRDFQLSTFTFFFNLTYLWAWLFHCTARQDFTLRRSFWNSELAPLSFHNFASLKGVSSHGRGVVMP